MRNNFVYVVSGGRIYKADLSNNNITVFAGVGPTGTPVDGPAAAAVFNTAHGCVFDASGNMFVADQSNIRKISTNGIVSTLPDFVLCDGCGGLKIDSDGYLLVTDYYRQSLSRVNLTDFSFSRVAGSNACPHADGQGINSRLCDPQGITQDSFKNLFVAEFDGHSVNWINQTNYLRRIAGDGTPGFSNVGVGKFDGPVHLAIDSKGRLFVGDNNNNAIRMITWD